MNYVRMSWVWKMMAPLYMHCNFSVGEVENKCCLAWFSPVGFHCNFSVRSRGGGWIEHCNLSVGEDVNRIPPVKQTFKADLFIPAISS